MGTGKTIAIVLSVLGGCGFLAILACGGLLFMGFRNADTAVSPRVDAMFNAMETGTFADTYETHTTAELRNAASKEEYAALGRAIGLHLGALRSKSLRSAKTFHSNATSSIDVTYAATFERGSGTITAQLKQEGGEWKFESFRVSSPQLDQHLANLQCSACGKPHGIADRFCPSCGSKVGSNGEGDDAPAEQPKTAEPDTK